MEGLITLIIIIVVFNIFNMILRALKGDRAPARQRVLVTAEQFLQDDTRKEESYRASQEDSFYKFRPDKEEISYPEKPAPVSGPIPAKTPVVNTVETKSNTLNSNLQQVFTKKDPLLAAFIFHEILEPPPALRRKR